AKIFRQIVIVTKNLRSIDIVHRDIRLANILMDEETCQVYFINFDKAHQLNDQMGPSYLKTNCFLSKEIGLHYPPEWFLLKSGELMDDDPALIWNLGIVFHLMISGKFPFEYQFEIKRMADETEPVKLPGGDCHLSKLGEKIISVCLIGQLDGRISLDNLLIGL